MNELSIKNNNGLSLSNKTVSEIAFNSIRLIKCEPQQQVQEIKNIIKTIYLTAGQTIQQNDFDVITTLIIKDIHARYKKFTIEEIKIAFNNGVRGDYGDYFGLNLVTFNKWLKAFNDSSERLEAVTRQREEKKEMKEPTKEELQKIRTEFLEVVLYKPYDDYKKTKKFKTTAINFVYDELFKNGFCMFTDGILNEIKEEAIEKAKEKAKIKRAENPRDFRIKELLRLFEKNEIKKEHWKLEARKISIEKQMSFFIDTGEDIRELIK